MASLLPSKASQKRTARTIVAVHESLSIPGLEVSAHELAKTIAMFVPHVFPRAEGLELRAVVTVQKALIDIMEINIETENERSRLFEIFRCFAASLAEELLRTAEVFVDFADLDGTPQLTTMGGSRFNEVEVVRSALGYRLVTVGGVSIVDHPRLGRNIYIGSVVTSATEEQIRKALDGMVSQSSVNIVPDSSSPSSGSDE